MNMISTLTNDALVDLHDGLTFLTCHYIYKNVTDTFVSSFKKQIGGVHLKDLIIVDNSPNTESLYSSDEIRVIDNHDYKLTKNNDDGNGISKNHCQTIDYILKNRIETNYCCLCDNDILFKPAIKNFIELHRKYDIVGEIGFDNWPPERLYPYLCLINVEKMKNCRLNYFDPMKMQLKNNTGFNPSCQWSYDTGCSFLEKVRKQPDWRIKKVKLTDFIVHKGAGSHSSRRISYAEFIQQNKALL